MCGVFGVVLTVSLMAVVWEVGALGVETDDPLEVVKTLIARANEALEKKNLTQIELPSFEAYMLIHAWIKNATFAKLDTIELRGEEQQIKVSESSPNVTNLDYNLSLGLKDFRIEGDFGLAMPFVVHFDGRFKVVVTEEILRLDGRVTVMDNRTCSAQLDSISLDPLGKIEVDIQAGGIGMYAWFVSSALQSLWNYVLPFFKNQINHSSIVAIWDRPELKASIDDFICQNFLS